MFRRRTNTVTMTPTKNVVQNGPPSFSTNQVTANPDTRMANGTMVADRYLLERTIGKGSYGKVKMAMDLRTNKRVAIKFIARSSIKKPAHTIRIRREINLLTALHHGNIVGLYETVETPYDIILVMEYIEGADLFERIVGHPEKKYNESEGRMIFEQIVNAIEYCHQHRVIHRDLKPENVMVSDEGRVKLIDFGFANMYHPRGYLETNCGSPLYAAPEIVKGVRYIGPEVDVWSLGVILFVILTGTLPFEDEQLKGLYTKICAGQYKIPDNLSTGAKDLIRRMLCIDTARRISISEIAGHPWLYSLALPPRPILFGRPSLVLYPDEKVLQLMVSFGFINISETRAIIANDSDDPATSIYHLLLRKQNRELEDDIECLGRSTRNLLTPPATPAKQFNQVKVISSQAMGGGGGGGGGPRNFYTEPYRNDLASPVIVAPPMLIHISDPPLVNGSEASSIFTSPANIVSQAAASVANRFRKLREFAFMSRTGGGGGVGSVGGSDTRVINNNNNIINTASIIDTHEIYGKESSPLVHYQP